MLWKTQHMSKTLGFYYFIGCFEFSKCLDLVVSFGSGIKTNKVLRRRVWWSKSQRYIRSRTEAAWEAETRLSGINMWKLKYQLALHLRGQYHYPITTKAAKTHSSSGIIKLSQWEYKASSSLSWWHSSAIWEAIPVCTMSAITSLTSVHLNSSH